MGESKKKVMVGMSGGVDSTVTALLLQQRGYDVVGVTFRLWVPEDAADMPPTVCCSIDDVRDAKMVCTSLGIPHYVFNYKDLFRRTVVDNFAKAYQQGLTPNPCVDCNRYIKFSDFLDRAKGMGYDYVATGHYARIEFDEQKKHYRFGMGSSANRDQSYFLYNLTRAQLASTLMPLGSMDKPEVRGIAAEHGFASSNKPDSQDICFVPDGDYSGFLENYIGKKQLEGDFVDTQGNVLGRHSGIWNYTIGQRKGLGIAFGRPMFVKEINVKANTVVLCEGKELFSKILYANDLNWIDIESLVQPFETTARIRSTAKPAPCTVEPMENGCKVTFNEPQRAITPGQSVVFYNGDYVVGGGTIISELYTNK